jgi:hypothetical protein
LEQEGHFVSPPTDFLAGFFTGFLGERFTDFLADFDVLED